MNLKYSKDAINDLSRLRAFIGEKNHQAARRIASELIKGINNLALFPQMGTRTEKAPDPEIMRDIFILDYHVRYVVLEKTIFILRIWHQKENR